MPIHRTGGAILSLTARALKHAIITRQESARTGLSQYMNAAAQHHPHSLKSTGSTEHPTARSKHVPGEARAGKPAAGEERASSSDGPGNHGKTLHGRLPFPPMTSAGFLSTKPGASGIAHTLAERSSSSTAAYATQDPLESPPAAVKQLRELIKTGKSGGLNEAAESKLLLQAVGLRSHEANHLNTKDKADIIALVGYDAILLRFDDELLPILGTTSKSIPELGPASLKQDFERVQKAIIDSFDSEGVMPELRSWGTPLSGNQQATMQRVANTASNAFNIQDPPKPRIDECLQQDASFNPEEPSVLRISARLINDKNSVQMVRAIVHETTHAAQYELIARLGGSDGMASGPYRDNALLLQASMDYVKLKISPRMNDFDHPDYRLLWVERQAFHMGDGVARHLADRLGVGYMQEGDVFDVDRQALAQPA